MKKLLWLFLFILVALCIVGGKSFFEQPLQPATETIRVNNPSNSSSASSSSTPQKLAVPVTTPQVSRERLLAHIQKLNFQRYTNTERLRSRNYITSELKKYGFQPQQESFPGGINIVAERLGSDKKAGAILIGAHYDTVVRSPGADDNGTGVAVVLEIAKLFGSRTTPRTLKLALFDQEETGLLGSRAFVAQKSHLKDLRGVIILDMLGFTCHNPGCQNYPTGLPIQPPSNKGDFIAVIGDTEHLPLLSSFQINSFPNSHWQNSNSKATQTTNLPTVLTVPIPLKGIFTPDTLRSDHAPFWYQGIGAVLITDTANLRNPHYHQPGDKLTNIDKAFFTGVAQIIVNATEKLLESQTSLTTPISTTSSPS
ncbi:M28 family peptidase [Calothrix sp. UHCC 0171]|uniref:M28 family peptidase n=1 Tax=Calothrix sp. UHCC 0171 TaxID=3110245 RepID=UPI002B1F3F23|nr:M28 family peptidase [Calothrix sp. UHCC 0171]MEA5572174.1 M28 family peptidase [Calothrix sp. UHCC 0171]